MAVFLSLGKSFFASISFGAVKKKNHLKHYPREKSTLKYKKSGIGIYYSMHSKYMLVIGVERKGRENEPSVSIHKYTQLMFSILFPLLVATAI